MSRALSLLILLAVLSACRSTGRLGEYDFTGGRLAVEPFLPPAPEVLTGAFDPGYGWDPVGAVVRAGTRIVKEIQADEVRVKLDSAAARVDVSERMAARALDRAARYLRTDATEDPAAADYVLEIAVRRYGVDAEGWDAAAWFFIDAEVRLTDNRDGSRIWSDDVQERERLTPDVYGPGTAVRDIVTASAFADLSVEEIATALQRLADYAADQVTRRLRDALDEVRERED